MSQCRHSPHQLQKIEAIIAAKPTYLSRREAGTYLRVAERSLGRWDNGEDRPADWIIAYRFGRNVRYRTVDVLAWAAAQQAVAEAN